jgi:phosphoribosylaminoimidazolecarboxamide formyltransferase / IMP cyclohydrolase
MNETELALRYGCNPHQVPARVYRDGGSLPITAINGSPGYINLLDALNSWQLVRELKGTLDLPAAASFKHVSPAGAAVAVPMNDATRHASFAEGVELSELATAYARARGADRLCSFGDWIALSDKMDVPTAELIRREVSDGVIAPDYEPAAVDILRQKQGGRYRVVQIDPAYEPPARETREVFGVSFDQRRNDHVSTAADLQEFTTKRRELPESAKRDLIVALTALKYTQSNSICLAVDGQVIGAGAGQQSRIHCTRLAAGKADTWYLRQHPRVLGLKFRKGIGRPDRDNAIDQYLRDDLSPAEEQLWRAQFDEVPQRLAAAEKREWLNSLDEVALGSDAFFPFRDNIDRAAQSGVRYIAQPGGSVRDQDIVAACDEYGIAMAITGVRLFHH